jgi:hypothetical protein
MLENSSLTLSLPLFGIFQDPFQAKKTKMSDEHMVNGSGPAVEIDEDLHSRQVRPQISHTTGEWIGFPIKEDQAALCLYLLASTTLLTHHLHHLTDSLPSMAKNPCAEWPLPTS